MSRRAGAGRKKVSDDEEEAPASSRAKSIKKKPSSASAAAADDDFPKLDFDMSELDAEIKEVNTTKKSTKKAKQDPDPPAHGDEDEDEDKPRKPRFPDRNKGKKKPDKEEENEDSHGGAASKNVHNMKMEQLDRWRWNSKYSEEGDQDEIRLAENMKRWEKIQLPDPEAIDAAAIMFFRKTLWKNKKLCREGIPPQYRLLCWEYLSGAKTMSDRLEHANRYQYYLKQMEHLSSKQVREINQDLPRALNGHPKYSNKSKEGAEELKRVLSAYAIRSPNIGYVNSLSHIAAYLLLYYKEEDAFWMLCAIVDIVLPPDYYTQSLLGIRSDCFLLKLLVFQRFPKLHKHLTDVGVDVSNVALKWLMTLYLLVLRKEVMARVFDVMFLEGSNIIISLGLALFFIHEKALMKIEDLMELSVEMGKMGSEITDNDMLMKIILKESKCEVGEDEDKRRHIERTVMENAYMKELQKTQLHRKLEEEKRKEEIAAQLKREKEEEQAVAMGIQCWKMGHWGDPHLTLVVMEKEGGEWVMKWRSKRKKPEESVMKIKDCELHFGVRYGQFKARPALAARFKTQRRHAFSLVSSTRSLDLVCQNSHDMEDFKKIFYRAGSGPMGVPFINIETIRGHRRRIEKKKTLKRMKLSAEGKKNAGNIKFESSDEDYDVSGNESEDDDHPAAVHSNLFGPSSVQVSSGLFDKGSTVEKEKSKLAKHNEKSDDGDAGDGEEEVKSNGRAGRRKPFGKPVASSNGDDEGEEAPAEKSTNGRKKFARRRAQQDEEED